MSAVVQKRLNKIVSRLARMEGKKSQVTVGNIREVIRCLIDMEIEDLKNCNSLFSTLSQLTGIATDRFQVERRKKIESERRRKKRK